MMIGVEQNTFEQRDGEEKNIMKKAMERILKLQNDIKPVMKEWDSIEFEIKENIVDNDDITGKYEVILLKNEEELELGIRELKGEYDEIIPFSELSPILDLKLIKALLIGIRTSEIVIAVNERNRKLWYDYRNLEDFYF